MKSPNLFLHCGGKHVERQDVNNVILPEQTRSYVPISHDTILNMVQENLSRMGFEFGIQSHALSHKGARYFGLVHLLHEGMNDDHALILGVRNALDKRFPVGISFGSCVFVCDNLAFTGDIVVNRKHTTHVMRDLPSIIDGAVSETRFMQEAQDERFRRYQERTIKSDKFAHDLIVEMYRRGAINAGRISDVVNEWHEPTFDHGDKSVWRLFNAATEALKGAPLGDMPRRTIELQAICDEVVA